jgi:hypothetical protein
LCRVRRCSCCACAGVGGLVKVRPNCKLNNSNLDVGVLYNIYNIYRERKMLNREFFSC